MYFPKGFDQELAIELGGLIAEAYEQFAAFEEERAWSLSGRYSLITELKYEYKPDTRLAKIASGFDNVRKFLRIGVKETLSIPIGFVAKRGNKVFIVFRGTKTPKEWLNNFSINFKEYFIPSFGNIHEGFLHVYESIREKIREARGSMDAGTKLYVTGHSLGAALATLSLPDIELNCKKKIRAVYTFGSPRVGDSVFAGAFNEAFKNRSYRIVNTSDIVTSIPLPVPLIGSLGGYFSHVDTPVDFTFQADDIEKNHDMKTYIAELEKAGARKSILKAIFNRSFM